MPDPVLISSPVRLRRFTRWTAPAVTNLVWLTVVAVAVAKLRQSDGVVVALTALAAVAATFASFAWSEKTRWRRPIWHATQSIRNLRHNPDTRPAAAPARSPEARGIDVGNRFARQGPACSIDHAPGVSASGAECRRATGRSRVCDDPKRPL